MCTHIESLRRSSQIVRPAPYLWMKEPAATAVWIVSPENASPVNQIHAEPALYGLVVMRFQGITGQPHIQAVSLVPGWPHQVSSAE